VLANSNGGAGSGGCHLIAGFAAGQIKGLFFPCFVCFVHPFVTLIIRSVFDPREPAATANAKVEATHALFHFLNA
jgi:hypothetical protein